MHVCSTGLEDSLEVKRFLDPNKFQIGGCQYENIPSSNGSTCDSAIERARINREHGVKSHSMFLEYFPMTSVHHYYTCQFDSNVD